MIAGMKYANPAWRENLQASQTPAARYDIDPLNAPTSRLDRDLNPPARPTASVAAQIANLKTHFKPVLQQLQKKINITPNVDPEQIKAIKQLAKDPSLHLGLSDKTNKIVAIDPNIVRERTLQHLQNKDLFREVEKDPSPQIEKRGTDLLNSILPSLNRTSKQEAQIFKRLYSYDTKAPVIQPLLKDHKAGFPHCNIRPVQPVTHSAVEKIDLLVSKVLTQITPHLTYRAKDTTDFKTRLRSLPTPPKHSFMVSLDIVNMYPCMPTDERALGIIAEYIEAYKEEIDLFGFTTANIVDMLRFVLRNTYISYEGRYFIQESGVGTGNHSSGPYSEIIVDWTYIQAMSTSPNEPIGLTCYVDDAWMLWYGTLLEFNGFKSELNSIWPTVKFEEEMEANNQINFLDLTITRTDDGIKYTFYQKATNSGRYLHYSSHCAMSTKLNIVKSEARRVIGNCSDINDAYQHLEKIKGDFLESGYPEETLNSSILEMLNLASSTTPPTTTIRANPKYILKVPYISEPHTRLMRKALVKSEIDARLVVTAGRSIKSLIKAPANQSCSKEECPFCKAGMPCSLTHYVYQLTCNTCPSEDKPIYIGCSRRKVPKRMGNHESSVRLVNERSTPGAHMVETHPSEPVRGKVDMDTFFKKWTPEILHRGRDTLDAFLWEGLKIRELHPHLNCRSQIDGKQINGFTDFF